MGSHDPLKSLSMIKILKISLQQFYIFIKFLKFTIFYKVHELLQCKKEKRFTIKIETGHEALWEPSTDEIAEL